MIFWGHHGVQARERRQGGPFDVALEITARAPALGRDRLSDTVDYARLHGMAKAIVERRRFKTVEALTRSVAETALKFPKVMSVKVRVTKLAPPLGGATAAVEIELSKGL